MLVSYIEVLEYLRRVGSVTPNEISLDWMPVLYKMNNLVEWKQVRREDKPGFVWEARLSETAWKWLEKQGAVGFTDRRTFPHAEKIARKLGRKLWGEDDY